MFPWRISLNPPFKPLFLTALAFIAGHLSLKAQWLKSESLQQAEAIVSSLSYKEQIAQLLMVPAWSKENQIDEVVLKQIRTFKVGGIIYFQGDAMIQALHNNFYQQESKLPLLIGIDGEWGLAMRLINQYKYPFAMTLGATENHALTEAVGKAIGLECRRLGVHINFAPDIDVNTEPSNPIIGFRSFGSNPTKVGQLGAHFCKGMQKAGTLACAKHFPGHGDTKTDSHKDLPRIEHSVDRLKSIDIQPYTPLIEAHVASIMMGHLQVPALDSSGTPASLSPVIIKEWVKGKLGFQGLIITDALNMKGVAKLGTPAEVAYRALLAGNDIILFPEDVEGFIKKAQIAKDSGWVDSVEIAQRVKKIIATKYQMGLFKNRFVDDKNLTEDIAKIQSDFVKNWEKELLKESIVDLGYPSPSSRNPLPWNRYEKDSILPIFFGDSISWSAYRHIAQYNQVKKPILVQWVKDTVKLDSTLRMIFRTHSVDARILAIGCDLPVWGVRSRLIPSRITQFLGELAMRYKTAYIHGGHIYAVRDLKKEPNIPIVVVFENQDIRMKYGISHLFGEEIAKGKMPIELPKERYQVEQQNIPVGYTYLPDYIERNEKNGETWNKLRSACNKLDSMLEMGISEGLYPSAQLVVLKDGKLFYQKAVGDLEVEEYGMIKQVSATNETVYDIASITKVAATTLALMRLYESNHLHLDEAIGLALPEAANTPWKGITIRELLMHKSGLPAFLPLQSKVTALGAKAVSAASAPSSAYFQIGENLWLNKQWTDESWNLIKESSPLPDKPYIYSDLNMIILGKLVEYKTGKSLDAFVKEEFYQPMGLKSLGYLPRKNAIPANIIAPSYYDTFWPRQMLNGFVHDPSCMFFQGVSGNAGLFSNAHDLACLFQMLNDGGNWNKKRYLKASTIEYFTRQAGWIKNKKEEKVYHYRGLGFDKPNGKTGLKANVFEGAPYSLFGHSGYTGTWAWCDPEQNMVFVFLSNRTYPSDNNKKITETGFRGRLLEEVYLQLSKLD